MALCQARSSTKPLWGLASSNPYHPSHVPNKFIQVNRFYTFRPVDTPERFTPFYLLIFISQSAFLRGSGWEGLFQSQPRRLILSGTSLADFCSIVVFPGFSGDILRRFSVDFTHGSICTYIIRLSRQIFQLFNKLNYSGKFISLRRTRTVD